MSVPLMKQAVLRGPHDMQTEMAPVPIPAPGEILVKVQRLGICGADTYAYDGDHIETTYPFIPGHEMSGEVADANGSAVYQNGDRVVVVPQTYCGVCEDCKSGNTMWCKENRIAGVWSPGMAREFVSYPERMLLKITDDMTFDVGAAIEPLSVAVHTSGRSGDIAGKNVLVLGAGVIGNFAAQVSKIRNAKKVVLAGRKEYRMDFARQCGIENLINTDEQDLAEAVMEQFGELPDVVLDCIGSGDSVNTGIRLCRKGGAVVVTGIYGKQILVDMFYVQDNEIRVFGTNMYTIKEVEWAIELVHSKKVIAEPLVTDHFTLDTFNEAHEYIAAKTHPYMKVVLDIG